MVRPFVLMTGLGGLAAGQAEAAGWAAAREALSGPAVRLAASPWGVVRASVKRAVFADVVAAFGYVSPRNAWALRAASGKP